MCSEESSMLYQQGGPLAVIPDEAKALREINGRYGIRALMMINVSKDPLQFLKINSLLFPTLKINSCTFDVKYKIWLVSCEI